LNFEFYSEKRGMFADPSFIACPSERLSSPSELT